MVPVRCRLLPVLALLAFVGVTSPTQALAADAATRSAARDLGHEGIAAFHAGDYAKASELLETAFATMKVPTLALWSARALEQNGKLVEAAERYYEATRLPLDEAREHQPQLAAQAEAQTAYKALKPRIPKVVLRIEGAEASAVDVRINGEKVAPSLYAAGRPTNPGAIEVVATVGGRTVTVTEVLAEGERKTVTLSFAAAAATTTAAEEFARTEQRDPGASEARDASGASNWQRPVGWAGVGLGAAGLVFGAVTGIVALDKYGQLNAACPGGECPPSQTDANGSYNDFRVMSSTGFIVGAVLGAAGVTLLLTAPKRRDVAHVSPYFGFASAGVQGAF